jgi:hypothetical protein
MMSAAAVAAGVAAGRYWMPCSGSMLNGSILLGYLYPDRFTGACLQRMDDGTPFPFIGPGGQATPGFTDATIASMALLGVAWLVFIATRRWEAGVRVLAALPGVLTVALALVTLLQVWTPALWPGETVTTWIVVAIDLTALVAAAVLVQLTNGLDLFAHLLALWGVVSFGWMRTIGDYIAMLGLSSANWDAPPGTGFITVVTIGLTAILAPGLGLWSRRTSRRVPSRPPLAAVPPTA